ncbi:MAG TPA: hypothetical protein PLM16_01660 [Candidatus Woesebacteria bacterium]|nr:hypothetical protein [Candidatus Woesebacteria bacterium]
MLSSYYFEGSSVVNINAGDIGPQAALSTFLASPDLVIDPQSKQRISLETYLQSQFELIEAAGYQISIETKTIAEILSDPDSLHPPSDSFTKGTSKINPNTTTITTLRIVLPDNRSLLIPFLAVSSEQTGGFGGILEHFENPLYYLPPFAIINLP